MSTNGELLWPHPVLLYLISQRHGVHVVVQSSFRLTLTPSELSPILYWYRNDFKVCMACFRVWMSFFIANGHPYIGGGQGHF